MAVQGWGIAITVTRDKCEHTWREALKQITVDRASNQVSQAQEETINP
jgi:hypothetical protein